MSPFQNLSIVAGVFSLIQERNLEPRINMEECKTRTQISRGMFLGTCYCNQFSSVAQCVRLFVTPWTAEHQASLPWPTPGVYSNSCPLSWWCHPTISSSVVPFSCLQSFPAFKVFWSESVLHMNWIWDSVSWPKEWPKDFMAKVLEFQFQRQSFQWTPRTDLH